MLGLFMVASRTWANGLECFSALHSSRAAPVFIKFQHEQTVLYPTAGIVNLPVLRVGSTGLTSYFFLKSYNRTTAGIPALPDVHYRCGVWTVRLVVSPIPLGNLSMSLFLCVSLQTAAG